MHNSGEMELLIWRFIDSDCTDAEKQYVLQQLATQSDWKNCYESLLELNNTIAGNIIPETPGLHFSENVIDKITSISTTPVYKQYINKWVIKGIAAFFIFSLGAILAYTVLHTDFSRSSGSFDYSRFLDAGYINTFIFVNIIIGLLFVDTLFRRRKVAIR